MEKKLLIASMLMVFSFCVFAQKEKKMTAKEVCTVFCDLDRVPDYNYTTLLLENIDKNGKSETLEIKQYGGGDNGLKNVAFDFRTPASVRGMRVLQLEKKKKADDRWVYEPRLRQSRRIPMTERTKSFGGTEFTYNDMRVRNEDEDENTMVEDPATVTVAGRTYTSWKIKSVPYKKGEVEYAYRISWFDKKTFIPVRIEFYDNKDKMIKLYECERIDMVKGVTGIEYPLRRKNRVSNLVTGRQTVATVKDYVFDDKVSSSYFTQSWLTTGKVSGPKK
ncbi:MAG: outer membrane lipoprotein-sorting protein [Treponema sp.]|nr:outer membrane lipoprotein-sorting protein [Treponema sp.]